MKKLLPLSVLLLLSRATDPRRPDVAGVNPYCEICANHTMCLFPEDAYGPDCAAVENADLDSREVLALVHRHNTIRSRIARGEEHRGSPGPQPTAKNMLQLTWDDELATLARRWILRCGSFARDACRDVARFAVWQNVNLLDRDAAENASPHARLRAHVDSWYDEVERFDSSAVGLIDYADPPDSCYSYIPLASADVNYVGCGRIAYAVDFSATMEEDEEEETRASATSSSPRRVEVLACNYGPVDRSAPHHLYDVGTPGFCPDGTAPSTEYESLCAKIQRRDLSRRKIHRVGPTKRPQRDGSNGAPPLASTSMRLCQLLAMLRAFAQSSRF